MRGNKKKDAFCKASLILSKNPFGLFRQVHALTKNVSDLVFRLREKFCEAFSVYVTSGEVCGKSRP